MERVTRTGSVNRWLFALVIALPAFAAAAYGRGIPERFPESRFGAPPERPEMGVGSRYAIGAVEALETRDDEFGAESWHMRENGVQSRAPAGLEFGGGTSQRSAPAVSRSLAPSLTPPEVNPVSAASAITRKGVQEVALIAGDLGFFPKTVFVSRDVPVRLFVTGASKSTLCIMMDSFDVRRQIRSQKIEEITFTPETPGRFRFYCPVNGMEGTLIVKEFASNHAYGESD